MSDQVAPGSLHARDRVALSIHALLDACFPGLVTGAAWSLVLFLTHRPGLVPRTRAATAGLGAVTLVLASIS